MPSPSPSSRGGETLFMRVGRVFKERNHAAEFFNNLRRKEPPVLSIKTLANLDKNINPKYPTAGNEEILDALRRKRNWFEIIIDILSIPGSESEKDLIDELMGIKEKFDAETESGKVNDSLPSSSSSDIPTDESRKRKIPQDSKPKTLEKRKKSVNKSKVHACDHCAFVVEDMCAFVKPEDKDRCITMWSSFRKKVLNLTELKKWNKEFFHGPFKSKEEKSAVAHKAYKDWLAKTQKVKKAQATPLCVQREIKEFFNGSKKEKPESDDDNSMDNGNHPLPSTSSDVPPHPSSNIRQEGSRKRKGPQGPKSSKTPKTIKVHACNHCLSVMKAIVVPVQPNDRGRCITMWSSLRTSVFNKKNLMKREAEFCHYPCTAETAKYRLACEVYKDWLVNTQRLTKAQPIPLCVRIKIGKMFDCSKTNKKLTGK